MAPPCRLRLALAAAPSLALALPRCARPCSHHLGLALATLTLGALALAALALADAASVRWRSPTQHGYRISIHWIHCIDL
eukprot:2661589-Prymnesium_polylepis.1